MLSTSIIKNSSDAGHYYTAKDNYYTVEEGIEQSEWFGRGTEKLNLKGTIDPELFGSLLKGILPTGEMIGKKIDDKITHRAGWDLTFSAPKSVSIMALLGGDKRLLTAHRHAVSVALSEIERGCSESRIKVQGNVTFQHTKNMIAALFHHDLSRAEDPQLHTHSVIMNLTERQDGKWRSMASKLGRYDKDTHGEVHGFIERVRHNKRFYGKVYEAELAYQVQQLGYEITTDEKTGVFQIKGVSQEAIDTFSKRRQKIEEHLNEQGYSGQKAAEVATLHTRDNKVRSDRSSLLGRWEKEAALIGFDSQNLIKQAEIRLTTAVPENEVSLETQAVEIVEKSIHAISQFKTAFTLEELVEEAASIVITEKVNIKNIYRAVDHCIEKGELLLLENEQQKTFLMSNNALNEENKIITCLTHHNKGQFANLLNITKQHITHRSITTIEKEALLSTFSDEKYVLLEGRNAKEFLSQSIAEIAQNQKLSVTIVSPNQITSKTLANDLKKDPTTFWGKLKSLVVDSTIPHYSTQQFLANKNKKMPDILLVDNSHLLSVHEQASLLEWGQNQNTKMIFFSEKNLLLSQKRSVDNNYLIKHGIKNITIHDTNISFPKENINKIFLKISPHTTEVEDQYNRLDAMASHFSRLKDNKNIYLIANNKETSSILNQLTHDKLKHTGQIKEGIIVNTLVPYFIPEHKKHLVSSYAVGQVIRAYAANNIPHVACGEYLHITGIDKKTNELILKRNNGKSVSWKPSERVDLFKEEKREWSLGERLESHRAIKSVNVVKGEHFNIDSIRGNIVKLTREKGKSVYLDISKSYNRHFDYGYAGTVHQFAHRKADQLIVDLPSNSFTTNQRKIYQVVSQSDKISVYTDNVSNLFNEINKKSGNKLSAHDILHSSQDVKNHLLAFYDVLQQAIHKPGEKDVLLNKEAINAVDYALHHLAERQAGFNHKDLLEVAITKALGHVNKEQLLHAIAAMEKSGIILRGNSNNGVLWTTQEAIKIENDIIAIAKKDQGIFQPIATQEIIQKYIHSKKLHPEQITAIQSITQSRDRVLSIEGRAGTGKTTMMATLADVIAAKEIFETEGYTLLGIAPTHKAVKELRSRGIAAQTIDRFLLDMRQILESKSIQNLDKTILIVDEASMVSNRKMRDVLTIGHELNLRQIIPTGDTSQLTPVEAGKPHHLIQRILDEKVIHLSDIRRQKNQILKDAVKAIYKGDVEKTFSTLGESIIEINLNKDEKNTNIKIEPDLSYNERVKTIAKDYIQVLEQKEDVQIITPSHQDRQAVNREVRHELEAKGILIGEARSFDILVSKDMTSVERSNVNNFKLGQTLRFTGTVSKNIKSGDYFIIKKVDKEFNLLELGKLGEKPETITWRIPTSAKHINNKVEVFTQEHRDLKIGDKIVWMRTNQKDNILSSEPATVTHIDKNKVTVEQTDKSNFTFDAKNEKYQHWDHAYAITAYGAQGGTYSTVLALFESYRKNLMNLKTFLVTLTRPENQLRIYTDDKNQLQSQIMNNKGNKLSSLEVVGQYPLPPNKNKAPSISHPADPHPQPETVRVKYDVERIKDGLNRQAEQLAIEILGNPKVRGSNFLKFGSKQGSLSVTTKGEKIGWWNDFSESNAKGRSMLSFIEYQYGLSKSEAIEHAAKWLGVAPDINSISFQKPFNQNKNLSNQPSFNETEYQKKMLARAKKIAVESIPLDGTMAEKYLKFHRGIDTEKLKISDDIRFHPGIYSSINKQKLPALISVVRNHKEEIISVEAVYLDPNTGDKAKELNVGKQTFGSKKGGSVTLQKGKAADTVVLAEGTVTGLSVAKALPDTTVKSVLGKQLLTQIDPQSLPKNIVICLDYDGKDLKSDKTIRDAADRLQANQKEVRFMLPATPVESKCDYNDVLKLKGESTIKSDFKRALSYQEIYQTPEPVTQILRTGLKNLGEKLSGIESKTQSFKAVTEADIKQFAHKTQVNIKQENQRIHQAAIEIDAASKKEIAPEINSKPIQFERDI